MSDLDEKILEYVRSERTLTKIKNVGGDFYRVNTYKRYDVPESVITRTRMDQSYYLMIDGSGAIHNLTKESKVRTDD
jgi:hypothetical protein